MTKWDIYNFAKEWQTLIAAILAFSGAWATILGVRQQIDHNKRVENKRASDEQFAARAVLPLALNEISAYAEKCMLTFNEAMHIADEDEKRIILKKLPDQPLGLLNTIKDAIRYSDEAQKNELSRVVAFYQVQSSRIRDHIDFAAGGPDPSFSDSQALIDAARLYSATSNLYSWARRDEAGGRINVSNADIMSTLRICIPDYEGNLILSEHIKIFRLNATEDAESEK